MLRECRRTFGYWPPVPQVGVLMSPPQPRLILNSLNSYEERVNKVITNTPECSHCIPVTPKNQYFWLYKNNTRPWGFQIMIILQMDKTQARLFPDATHSHICCLFCKCTKNNLPRQNSPLNSKKNKPLYSSKNSPNKFSQDRKA
jgi:hypothetical protein